ncbi:DNA replication factor Cdt1-like [Dreissena polymorpha]|uniref:CDT1 Geminin-binding domain-containing protein n=1 Tax=Dreissena polymorpha TaxID=45954 RepID=A0A9D4E703_DREPO|nr:DNA replication factor Cdt1-like [Dreissena polymorpha]KAH3774263.1 hypothetical protein DPMN_175639 [Dreissena polymorpha]
MSQGKVTDFFSTRKRNPGSQPSKRRKVEIQASEVDFSTLEKTNIIPYQNIVQNTHDLLANVNPQPVDERKENVFSPVTTRSTRREKAVKEVGSVTKKTTRTRKAKIDPKQKLIADTFANRPEEKSTIAEDVTSSWDEHDGAPATPQKPEAESETETKTRKRTRLGKTVQKDDATKSDEATPEKRPVQAVEETVAPTKSRARRKLAVVEKPAESDVASKEPAEKEVPCPEQQIEQPTAMKAVDEIATKLEKVEAVKQKASKKMDAADIKNKLAKVTNLDDLKKRLADMKETRKKIKVPAPALKKFDEIKIEVDDKSDVKPKVPAYERFHHLTTESPPTLTLPYKYRLLSEHFRGMDQVVSILHNRNEVCTFSKLKTAVQELNKRNFEEHHLGQIKTVFPEAYELRQEKGLPNAQGFRNPGYQLTVEARPHPNEETGARGTFKASDLLTRRNHFNNSLINVVKKHHKKFLANLDRPLSIPDEKITRWHPRFPLDEVPDIDITPLPSPPDVQMYQTARDVLENTCGKTLSPKVEAALKSTADEAEKSKPAPKPTPTTTPVKADPSVKGIPQSLLEKIRSKEAAKAVESLTRDPKAEKRVVMLKRLPDIMRIIRSQFVTDKKPALPIDSVIQRILDSYKSCIAQGDVEPHIQLCIEVVPEWLSMVTIQKGRYLKMDRNIDLQTLTDKVTNIAKGKQ